MKTDDKDREGGDSHGAIGAKLMEYALKVRKVFVTGGVDEKMAKDVVQQLHILASISDDPIYMFVNSPGGHVESGDMIFDAIRFITPKVIMIGSGSVALSLIHISEPTRQAEISYAVFCLKKKKKRTRQHKKKKNIERQK